MKRKEGMREIVINSCYGGFGLSPEALELYKNIHPVPVESWRIRRDDPDLVFVVKKLGEKADGSCAKLKIVEIPEEIDWIITDYAGIEQIEEAHKVWY
jgi:hypothetical protein